MRALVIGAHPDDGEFAVGGTAALWRRRGDIVRFVSVTDGGAGHFAEKPERLVEIRREEAFEAGRVLDVEYEIFPWPDGGLEPTLDRRLEMIRLIRSFAPDLIVTHRPNDYHPDHRYTSVLVQDSAYMVTVPLVCPDTPHLRRNPVIAYMWDDFRRPCPFEPDVIVPVDSVMELKWRAMATHASQFFEWLPYNDGTAETVPLGAPARLEWLERRWTPHAQRQATQYRERIEARLGPARAASVRFVETFEIAEHGYRPTAAELASLFPDPE